MVIPTGASLVGHIASDPQLKYISKNVARFHAVIRVDYPPITPEGRMSDQQPTFHDLVAFKDTAEHAYAKFRRGDAVVASGTVSEYTLDRDGESNHFEAFVAQHIGHDAPQTRYTVDRTASHQAHRSADRRISPPSNPAIEL